MITFEFTNKEESDKPVIVTAANKNYYELLQNTLFHIHTHLPDYKEENVIVYDLGLDEEMHNLVKFGLRFKIKNCLKFILRQAFCYLHII